MKSPPALQVVAVENFFIGDERATIRHRRPLVDGDQSRFKLHQLLPMTGRSFVIWIALYLAVMGALWFGLATFRKWAIDTYGSPQAQQNWETWSKQVDRQAAGEGPVARRRLRSKAPPALVLMTDYFWSVWAITIVLSSALFCTFAFLIRGVLRSPTQAVDDQTLPEKTSQ